MPGTGIRRWIKRGVAALGVVILALVAIVLIRTLTVSSRQPSAPPGQPVAVDADGAAQRLGQAVTFRTVTVEGVPIDPQPFVELHGFLARSFPRVHGALEREVVACCSLLYTWRGSDAAAAPALLMGHLDVVPADPATWSRPPFSGEVADGFIWGRGTLDDKVTALGVLEAAEALLAEGFAPRRTVYFAFGHDEEIGGSGAEKMAQLLERRGVTLDMVLDEGLVITEGVLDGLERPLAMLGVAEKGYLTVEITVRTTGGHSALPPRETAIGILARAIHRLEAHPMPGGVDGVVRDLLVTVAPEMPFVQRMAMSNLWLFEPVVESMLASDPASDAMLRTTTAPTMVAGGEKENVLADHARGVINFRLAPGDASSDVLDRVRAVIDDDRVTVTASSRSEASEVVAPDSASYQLLARTVRQTLPDVLVAPGLVPGITDSRHYRAITRSTFRFVPARLGPRDLERLHGSDERLAVANYAEIIQFYAQLVRNLDG